MAHYLPKLSWLFPLLMPSLVSAQTSSSDPLPAALERGINLAEVYGNYNWRLLYDPDGVGYGTYERGDNPYPLSRMADSYTTDDFHELAKRGFTHVRFTIDPWALGMLESPGLGLPPTFEVTEPGKDMLIALREDIEAAWEEGIWSIVDFHPVTNAKGHWNITYNSVMNPGPLLTATDTAPIDYPGVYKWHFFKLGTSSTPCPLAKAWASISQELGSFDHPIVFEILNEPLDNAWEQDNDNSLWSLDGAGSIGGLPFDNTQPATWIFQARANWPTITKETIASLEGENRYIIVSPPSEDPGEFDMNSPTHMVPFDGDDCDYPENLIYACHFYVPGDFTQHWNDWSTFLYSKSRDYSNVGTQVYGDTPMDAKLAYVGGWHEAASATLAEDNIPVHMVFTEFGAVRDNRTRPNPAPGSGGGRGFPSGNGSGSGTPGGSYPTNVVMYSAKWIYDARKGIEASGPFGWTYFNVIGGFGAYDGSYDNNGWGNHGDWDGINVQVRDALFAP